MTSTPPEPNPSPQEAPSAIVRNLGMIKAAAVIMGSAASVLLRLREAAVSGAVLVASPPTERRFVASIRRVTNAGASSW